MTNADSQALPEDLRRFTSEERWTYAKTMPTWPHEYLVRERVNSELFVHFVMHIRANGYDGHFYQRSIRYFDEDGWVYWTMGEPIDDTTIINRCRKEATFEYRKATGTLPANDASRRQG